MNGERPSGTFKTVSTGFWGWLKGQTIKDWMIYGGAFVAVWKFAIPELMTLAGFDLEKAAALDHAQELRITELEKWMITQKDSMLVFRERIKEIRSDIRELRGR